MNTSLARSSWICRNTHYCKTFHPDELRHDVLKASRAAPSYILYIFEKFKSCGLPLLHVNSLKLYKLIQQRISINSYLGLCFAKLFIKSFTLFLIRVKNHSDFNTLIYFAYFLNVLSGFESRIINSRFSPSRKFTKYLVQAIIQGEKTIATIYSFKKQSVEKLLPKKYFKIFKTTYHSTYGYERKADAMVCEVILT